MSAHDADGTEKVNKKRCGEIFCVAPGASDNYALCQPAGLFLRVALPFSLVSVFKASNLSLDAKKVNQRANNFKRIFSGPLCSTIILYCECFRQYDQNELINVIGTIYLYRELRGLFHTIS
jgi:hypothetical protein